MKHSGNIFQAQSKAATGSMGSKWFRPLAPKPFARLRLFCFPYAGGDALTIFRKWPQVLPATVEICPVQIPGRGIRLAEPPFTSLVSIVEAIGEAIGPHLDKPFAFFGHSMGAMISFELSRLLRRERGLKPQVLFVSGRAAPQIPDWAPPTYNLPEPEFLEELKKINGTPREALEHPELMKLMLPILKADFQICQTHTYVSEAPLACPITVFGGIKDKTTRENLEAWSEQTVDHFSLHLLPSDHFFIKTEENTLLRILFSRLSEVTLKL
jgi:medium-chain acyl-[acyl-carrier-protein] hydrolase